MIDNVFRLKPFTIRHGEASQKVGTDALLLGAWPFSTLPSSPLHLLDVGTGTGIIALMLAERFPSAHIEAWEVDNAACRDAAANFEVSPYTNRLTLHEVNYLDAVKTFASPLRRSSAMPVSCLAPLGHWPSSLHHPSSPRCVG